MGKQRITNSSAKKPRSREDKLRLLAKQHEEWTGEKCDYCFTTFIVVQTERGNSKATIDYYKRFRKKFEAFLCWLMTRNGKKERETDDYLKETPVDIFVTPTVHAVFVEYMQKMGANQQTINSYLRAYRAFGNWLEEEGYIEGFKCPIKEVEPPVKQVYTDADIKKMLVKPKVDDFVEFRTYCIICLILNTGARSNTILNIRISDLELEEGYINFNTTKAHKVVRLGLERKTKRNLTEWLQYWRLSKGAEEHDYLFCNEYGEQLSRNTLAKSFADYNKRRGVDKTSLHLLRHTFAKRWITSGGDIITLARVLTHSELEMVKRYSNLYGGDIKAEIEEHSIMSQVKRRSGKTLKNQ